ncbi:hypothetical protein FRC08_015062, partial [Ceratobasidium sp. 394]
GRGTFHTRNSSAHLWLSLHSNTMEKSSRFVEAYQAGNPAESGLFVRVFDPVLLLCLGTTLNSLDPRVYNLQIGPLSGM